VDFFNCSVYRKVGHVGCGVFAFAGFRGGFGFLSVEAAARFLGKRVRSVSYMTEGLGSERE